MSDRRRGAKLWLGLVFVFLYAPLLCLVVFSFTAGEITTRYTGFSLRWYAALAADVELQAALRLSLGIAALAATAALILGVILAVVLVRVRVAVLTPLLAGLSTAPMVMPEVVIGLALVLLFSHPALQLLGGRGVGAIWIAHTTLCAAYVSVLVQSRLQDLAPELEEAALDLGCPPLKVFFLITVPVIAPALAAAWLLSFTLSMDDFVLAAMLSDPGSTTLPVLVFARLHHGLKPEINALATLIIVLVSLAVFAAHRVLQKAQQRRSLALQAARRR